MDEQSVSKAHPEEHMWLRDVRRHPEGEVRLYVDGRLVSGTFASQVVDSLDRITSGG